MKHSASNDSCDQKKKVLAISGSTKKNSTNESILKTIADLYKDELEVELFAGIDALPHFNPDLDRNDPPAVVKSFRDSIAQADGVLICTPEYVFSLPGSLKNAIEWCVSTTVFSNKPVAMIVAAASGQMAFESLSLILTTIEARLTNNSKLLIQGAKGKIGKEGEIKDHTTLQGIRKMMASLVECMAEENPVPTKYQ